MKKLTQKLFLVSIPGVLTVGGVANRLALTVERQLESAQTVAKAANLVGHQERRSLGILMETATAGNRPLEWVSAQPTGKLLQTIPMDLVEESKVNKETRGALLTTPAAERVLRPVHFMTAAETKLGPGS